MKHELAIMGRSGHDTVTWETDTDTAEAQAAIAEAARIFDEHRGRGASAFVVDRETKEATRIDVFDPEAEQITIVPRMQGGRE